MAVPVKKYRVILIEEGLGNTGTCYYYTREALQYAADNRIFEGKKAYANHPDAIEEKTRPERSVRDIFGYYENVHVVSGQSGQALLIADLCMPIDPANGWAATLIEAAIDTAGKFNDDYVGFSINASGDAVMTDLDLFMRENAIPTSALAKLIKAKQEGVTEIQVCSRLMEAVSTDLVTEAGAGGRVLKMLESERKKTMAKKTNPDPKKNKVKEDGAGGSGDPANDPNHEDVQQDVELIKSLLAEYCGSDDPSEEECQSMHQALENAKEMGLEGKDAHACAGNAMKMAKHVAEKAAKEAGDGTPPPPPAKKKPAPAPAAGDGSDDPNDGGDGGGDNTQEGKKMESRVTRLEATNARLEAELATERLEKHVEKTVRESGLPKSTHKKLRESLVTAKSIKQVDGVAKTFKEAFGLAGGATDVILNPEKDGGSGGGEGFSFADCVVND